MTPTLTEPILEHWTLDETADGAVNRAVDGVTAADLARRLATIEVANLDPPIVPYLAAAAAELAIASGTPWRSTPDALPIALLRMIAKIGIVDPTASGPHTARLHALLA